MQSVAKTLEQAIISCAQEIDTIPEDIIVSFPSANFVCDIISTEYLRLQPATTLTMKELDTMIKKLEQASYYRSHSKYKQKTGSHHDDLRLISSSILSLYID